MCTTTIHHNTCESIIIDRKRDRYRAAQVYAKLKRGSRLVAIRGGLEFLLASQTPIYPSGMLLQFLLLSAEWTLQSNLTSVDKTLKGKELMYISFGSERPEISQTSQELGTEETHLGIVRGSQSRQPNLIVTGHFDRAMENKEVIEEEPNNKKRC